MKIGLFHLQTKDGFGLPDTLAFHLNRLNLLKLYLRFINIWCSFIFWLILAESLIFTNEIITF
jgi:hypothetical protein